VVVLGGAEVEPHEGAVVYAPRGARHKAPGVLTVLVVCIPLNSEKMLREAARTIFRLARLSATVRRLWPMSPCASTRRRVPS
jgi:hypothetical protein